MTLAVPTTSSDVAGIPSLDACPWCGAPLAGEPVRCRACGVGITRPWPSDGELERAYAGAYRPRDGRFAGPVDALLHRTRGALARRLDGIAPPGTVLDVGAGDGALVAALRARGREAVGLERDAAPALDGVTAASLDDLDGPFAAIVFWHSLEHLREPGEALSRAASLLLPGGVLVVALPNAESLQARAFGEGWLALDRPRHLVHVPAAALRERLAASGLRVERESHWRGGQVAFGWLHGLVGLVPGTGDLYDAVRRPAARQNGALGAGRRAASLAAGALLAPAALAASAVEVAARAGGSVYVEARRG